MAKASLKLFDGTVVIIEGSPDEIAKIMALHSTTIKNQKIKTSRRSRQSIKSSNRDTSEKIIGPQQRILDLKSIGFFDDKKTISDIQKKLEEQGNIYAQTSLSTPLVRLVRSRDLRRLKQEKIWVYVKP